MGLYPGCLVRGPIQCWHKELPSGPFGPQTLEKPQDRFPEHRFAHKLAIAAYYVIKGQEPFKQELMFGQ
jgi:hypothetical protein